MSCNYFWKNEIVFNPTLVSFYNNLAADSYVFSKWILFYKKDSCLKSVDKACVEYLAYKWWLLLDTSFKECSLHIYLGLHFKSLEAFFYLFILVATFCHPAQLFGSAHLFFWVTFTTLHIYVPLSLWPFRGKKFFAQNVFQKILSNF